MIVTKPELAAHHEEFLYNFGPFRLYPDGTLFRDTDEVRLPPKELSILRILLSRAGQVVPSEQLRLSAWGKVHVSPDSLPRCVSSLRAHLESPDCIKTVYKRGYRFVIPVTLTKVASLPKNSTPHAEADLRTPSAIGLPRLAILPFSTANDVPAFFGTAVAEETMIRLARTPNSVAELIARDSIVHLVARGASAQEVGKTLGADIALTGSITALPLHYRIRIEMIRVADSVQVWFEDFLLPRNLMLYADARAAKRIAARIRNAFLPAVHSGRTTPSSLNYWSIRQNAFPSPEKIDI